MLNQLHQTTCAAAGQDGKMVILSQEITRLPDIDDATWAEASYSYPKISNQFWLILKNSWKMMEMSTDFRVDLRWIFLLQVVLPVVTSVEVKQYVQSQLPQVKVCSG